MSVIGSAQPDVVRIKVYKPNSNTNDASHEVGSSKKFCIDPRLTTYQTLQCLIAQAFDIKTDFTIQAIHKCPTTGREQRTAIWSDWDLDASIQAVQPDSYLRLRYELTPREEGLDDWDFIGLNDFNANIRWFNVDSRSIIATVNHTAGKAASALNKAINWMYGGNERRSSRPVNDSDMKRFLDCEGRLINVNELRQAIFEGGVEPSYRKVVWRHLLNIFPPNMTGLERIDYLKCIEIKYKTLKKRWTDEQHQNEHTRLIMRTIEKDVSRIDRAFGFYGDSGRGYVNVQSLFHILMTYCFSHPNITYNQGMNDYASTLLYIMRDESLAYICFCSIMKRIQANFATDGVAIATKLHHLKILLKAIDPVYWSFLESCDAVNLYFTYRWLLLECKREFPHNDALRVLEVMWATLPIDNEPPQLSDICLITSPSDTMIADSSSSVPCEQKKRRALSCPPLSIIDESNSRKYRHRTSSFSFYNKEQFLSTVQHLEQRNSNTILDNDEYQLSSMNNTNANLNSSLPRSRGRSIENSFSLSEISEFDFDNLSTTTNNNTMCGTTTTAAAGVQQNSSTINWLQRLFNDEALCLEEENLFLLFLCVSILLVHRNFLLKQTNLDEQEISIHFDRYRRRHNGERILSYARTLYAQYIQWARKKRMLDDLNNFSGS
ncbi:unnamed protein product [Rotaria sp. Silwood1]|nr:unnamed protein product [Rotaria sp. Silwood1]CAF3338087.1 unnamed protein product [Rotaria sp. Silwood1]CAF4542115.1 unnamed protein product [Rotaria sp. Silwood1]CAF4593242.1 unnamed protein product [Rotaria sp. Silwood1]CAF4769073.1 unnamed protein product [Rotaria sp. Silwood1]